MSVKPVQEGRRSEDWCQRTSRKKTEFQGEFDVIVKERGYLQTGQIACHDAAGKEIPCQGSGQDAEFKRGIPWPHPRFTRQFETVRDNLTGLAWTRNANLAEFPLTWNESFDFISRMNREGACGYSDWRLPNRRELRSLMSHHTKKPALPEGHPFRNVLLGWYWTSTSAAINPAYAWYIHTEGARMFYGGKEQPFLLWPVRGEGYDILPATGQTRCYDKKGICIPCMGSGQDGELLRGCGWPSPRFEIFSDAVADRLTGLLWLRLANMTEGKVAWEDAIEAVAEYNRAFHGTDSWRLPNINELESLVDCSMHSPALPKGHPFIDVQEGYWSATTSMFEPDWAWALYLTKGAVGVGQKCGAHFSAWAVCDAHSYGS